MRLEDCRELARALMARHGLSDWQFSFDGARRRLGACWLDRRRITLSRHFAEMNREEQVRDVILHEIAHALTPGDGHGAHFKRMARRLGCTASACVDGESVNSAPPRYLLRCPHCDRTWPRYRRPVRKLVCSSCAAVETRRVEPLLVTCVED